MKALPAIVSILALLAFVACGDEGSKNAGEGCDLTSGGAASCRSGVCMTVSCSNAGTVTKKVNVCAGSRCKTASTCGTGQLCLDLNGQGYCIPYSVCD